MSNYENLVRLRRLIAEFKIYINRTQTYLAPLQLFMIFVIFLDTTVWNVSSIQVFFGSKLNLMAVGTISFIAGVLVLGYIDTRLRLFRVEQGRQYAPERNPFTPLYLLWTAILLENKKNVSHDLEKKIKVMITELDASQMYEELKSALSKETTLKK